MQDNASLPPVEGATMLADLVGILIPGGDGWPSASAVGVQGQLAARLMIERGDEALSDLMAALKSAGAPFVGLPEARCIEIVQALEAASPELFAWVRDAVFMAYYESPFVAAAINAKGHPYKLRPHLSGYAVQRFDRERDTPRHGRGGYVPTDRVQPVDIAGLELETKRTQAWGLQR